jgi:hypothetical protein
MDIAKVLLIAGGAYIAYEMFVATPATAQTNTSPTAPSFTKIDGSLVMGQAGSLTVTVANVTGSPAFYFNQVQVTANLTGTPGVYTVLIPANLITKSSALGVTATNGKAAATLTAADAATPPRENPVSTTNGAVGGHTFNSKVTFIAALKAALLDASNNATLLSIDSWNWYMVNAVNATYLVDGVGPDPSGVATQLGIDRGGVTTAVAYVDALDALGLIVYPTGLVGLSALARGIASVNKHPFAGRGVRAGKVVIQ